MMKSGKSYERVVAIAPLGRLHGIPHRNQHSSTGGLNLPAVLKAGVTGIAVELILGKPPTCW